MCPEGPNGQVLQRRSSSTDNMYFAATGCLFIPWMLVFLGPSSVTQLCSGSKTKLVALFSASVWTSD